MFYTLLYITDRTKINLKQELVNLNLVKLGNGHLQHTLFKKEYNASLF